MYSKYSHKKHNHKKYTLLYLDSLAISSFFDVRVPHSIFLSIQIYVYLYFVALSDQKTKKNNDTLVFNFYVYYGFSFI